MYDAQLSQLITNAVTRLQTDMTGAAPVMAQHVSRWMQYLAGTTPPANYFKHPQAFPSLLLPWWLEKSLLGECDLRFQADLVYSTINGYYAIRLCDNLMDGHTTVELKLLPALQFFLTRFQQVYHPYFAADHPFWNFFNTTWFHSAEVTLQDTLLVNWDAGQFKKIAAQKTCAAKIPLAAVCYYYNRADMLQPWSQWVDLFGCWHQLLNDCFGWYRDHLAQIPTYFLAEAERQRQPDEPVAGWVARQGFTWALETAQPWMSALQTLGQQLNSPELLAYLETREAMLQSQAAQLSVGLAALSKLSSMKR